MIIGIRVKRFSGLLLLLLVATVANRANAIDSTGRAIGEAYDLKSDEFLYREVYCTNGKPKQMEVIYRNDDGQVLARKLLDYSTGAMSPSFVQQNYYSSEVIEIGLQAGELTISITDAVSAESKKSSSTRTDSKLPVVIDAGFDEYIRSNWDGLLAGEKKRFLFPFADHARLVGLRIKKTECSYDSDDHQCFRLELSNWFLRMLVSPIELGYDPERQRLMRYRGLSNIGDGKGNGSVVDIRYDYQNIPALACNLDDQALTDTVEAVAGRS